ncbi:MAG TPA: uracil-DNA glycosylase [Candidatus Kapabacteria bacterium]|nr:uracil-DNA glycosylase [Candidatus Kapabacteria bacterium]
MFKSISNWLEYQKDTFGNSTAFDQNDLDIIYKNFSELNTVESQSSENMSSKDIIVNDFNYKKNAKTIAQDWYNSNNLMELNNSIKNCMECPLGDTRTNFVFGSGNPNADIMIIGEAPGADEDEQGLPFVGRAGQLLTNMLEAIQIKREEVYIANIIKCRPPNNRRPTTVEINECEPYLYKQIELIKPKLILVLGLTAVSSLLKKEYKMSEIRGTIIDFRGAKLLITYHPAALLRNPNWKKPAWEDLKLLKQMYDKL